MGTCCDPEQHQHSHPKVLEVRVLSVEAFTRHGIGALESTELLDAKRGVYEEQQKQQQRQVPDLHDHDENQHERISTRGTNLGTNLGTLNDRFQAIELGGRSITWARDFWTVVRRAIRPFADLSSLRIRATRAILKTRSSVGLIGRTSPPISSITTPEERDTVSQ